MDNRELEMYKVEDIIKDLLDNIPIKQIARKQKVSKNTIKSYRDKIEIIKSNNSSISICSDYLIEEIREMRKKEKYSDNFEWLSKNKQIVEEQCSKCENIVILYDDLKNRGFKGSYSALIRYFTKNNLNKENPVMRIETKAGEIAQVDFGYSGLIYDELTLKEAKSWIFVMVLAFSRSAYYEIVRNQNIETWCNCHIHAFEHFGGVPKIIIPDNLKSGIIKASFLDPVANKSYADLSRHYSFQINPCIPRTPEHKGKVESGVKYVKNNFLPLKTFKDFNDANRQLSEWNHNKAEVRIHGTTRQKPSELFDRYEKKVLTKLNHERFEIPLWKQLKVYRDIHIQLNKGYYSIPYKYRGEYVWARITISQVAVFHDNNLIAVHIPVSFAGQRRTNPDHYPANKYMFMQYDSDYCIKKAKEIGNATYSFINKILNEEPIHNLRSAQNIIRLSSKYELLRLENACGKAMLYGNYTYKSIKNILEKNLENESDLFSAQKETNLNSFYARDLKEILQGGNYGNINTNQG
jgi:transposase